MALCQKFGRLLIGAEARFSARTDVTNISTSPNQSPAPTQIPARLPYKAPNAFTLFIKDQMTGQRGRVHEMGKILSTNWKNLSEEEKQNYFKRAKKIGDELRDNFEKLTDGQKKELWDKHVEKMNKRRKLQMKIKLNKFYAEANRPKRPLTSNWVFIKECFEKQIKPIKTRDKVNKFVAEMGQQWRQMTDAEKQPYIDQGQSDRAAYHKEMAEWKRKYSNEIRAWKEAEAKAAQKARGTQFTEAFEWNIDGDRDLNENEGPEILKILSIKWKNLSEEEKQNYSERAKKIGDELRDNFEKLTNGQKKDLWDKHVEKRNKLQRLQMKKKLQKFYAETNRPKQPMTSNWVFIKERFEKQTNPIKTRDKVNKFVAEMSQRWRQMTDAEKRPYVDQWQCNIAKFRVELAEWNQKYASEIRAWKEAEAEAAQKARDTQFTQPFEWSIDGDRDLKEKEGPEILKILSIKWKNLSEEEKQNYSERAKKIGNELRDNFEKLTNRQKKDLWDKHVEKRNKLLRLRMKKKLHKFYAETNRPTRPLTSYSVFMQKCFDKQTKPIKTKDKANKFFAEMVQRWRQMTDAEKQPYVDQAQCNLAAYHKEMAEWKQKYANEIRAWKEAKAKAALKAKGTQFNQAHFEWNIDGDRNLNEQEAIQQMILDDSTHLVEKRERSKDDDRDEDKADIQRMFLAISTYLGRKEISQNQRIEY
uniref:HMG box domain-containing protein n=1 Tax=Globodera pallida TaxID=36090 RepID=A0A183CN90_GLOPA